MSALKAGGRAPEFTLPDMSGGRRSLEELRREGPVLAAFFKVNCPTCQYTFPFLERLHGKRGAGAWVVGISQDARQKTDQFQRDWGLSFPLLLDAEEDGYTVSNAYGLTHVPALFLIEPDGRVALASAGFVKADLEEMSRRLGAVNLFHRDEKIEAFRAG